MERRTAQNELKEFREKTVDAFKARIQELEKIVGQSDLRLAAAAAQLSAAEQRASRAETRVIEAENTLKRVEQAIRIRIMEKLPSNYSPKIAAVA
jgi:exonuclease VII small subunit